MSNFFFCFCLVRDCPDIHSIQAVCTWSLSCHYITFTDIQIETFIMGIFEHIFDFCYISYIWFEFFLCKSFPISFNFQPTYVLHTLKRSSLTSVGEDREKWTTHKGNKKGSIQNIAKDKSKKKNRNLKKMQRKATRSIKQIPTQPEMNGIFTKFSTTYINIYTIMPLEYLTVCYIEY